MTIESRSDMKRTLFGIVAVLALLGLVPFGMIALSRSRPSPNPPIHPILDMVLQPKFKTQTENPMFADGRAMRPLLPGVAAKTDLLVPNQPLNEWSLPRMIDNREQPYEVTDQAAYGRLFLGTERQGAGKDAQDVFATQFLVPITMDLLRRGRERYNIFCAVCHGLSGYGDGMVARRAAEMQAAGASTASGWVAPTNYHLDDIRNRAVGHLYNTIANGIRTMPAYDKQIPVLDRWAIVAYVKALQRSQNAKPSDVPETERDKYK